MTEPMSRSVVLGTLLLAAILEAGGDALVRSGLRAPTLLIRLPFFALGSLLLFFYGYLVNTPPWDFGRLLGLYIVLFFVIAQGTSWMVFGQPPSRAVWVGGAFVVAGGVIIAWFD